MRRTTLAGLVRNETAALHYGTGMTSREVASIMQIGRETVLRSARARGGFRTNARRPVRVRRYQRTDGRWFVRLSPDHPLYSMADPRGYQYEHRVVLAEILGRPLRPDEQVHHKDGDPSNNDPSNLQLRVGNHGVGRVARCACCGSSDIEFVEV